MDNAETGYFQNSLHYIISAIRVVSSAYLRLLIFPQQSWGSSRGTHLPSFFTFSICFKCQTTTECSTATSPVAVKRISFGLSVGHCQLLMAGRCAPCLQGSPVAFAQLLKPPLLCVFVRSSWAMCTVDVESCLHCFMTHIELE